MTYGDPPGTQTVSPGNSAAPKNPPAIPSQPTWACELGPIIRSSDGKPVPSVMQLMEGFECVFLGRP